MNSVQLIGRLTTDPDLAERSGTVVGKLRIAVQRPKRDGEDQGADYVDVTTFGRQAEVCAQYLDKGRRVAVQGRLHHSEWKAEDGSNRQKLEVVANQVDFLDSPQRDSADEADSHEPAEQAVA
jgi:single-strand DNA-binding protein